MKKMKCDLCNLMAEGESFEQWLNNLMPHYLSAHSDQMNHPSKTKEDQLIWMTENKLRFDAAETIN